MYPTTKTQLESMVSIMTSLNYTTNIIDSTVKSCLNYHDPHLIFDDEPYKDTLRGTKYLLFPATIYRLAVEAETPSSNAIVLALISILNLTAILALRSLEI